MSDGPSLWPVNHADRAAAKISRSPSPSAGTGGCMLRSSAVSVDRRPGRLGRAAGGSTRRSGGGSLIAVASAETFPMPLSCGSTRRSAGGSGMSCHGGRTRPSPGWPLTGAGGGGGAEAADSSLELSSGQLAREPGGAAGVSSRWPGSGNE